MAINRVSPRIGKVVDIPSNAPTIGTATNLEQDGKVSVAFTAPSTATGGPIFGYTAVSNPGSITGTGTTSPITVSGLTNDTSYTFQVYGTNPTGSGPLSSASNSVAPTTPPSAWESIATITATSTVSEFSFTDIPQTYKHLHLRGIVRQNDSAHGYGYLYIRVNSGSGYNNSMLGTSSISVANNGSGYIQVPLGVAGTDNSANVYGALIVDLHAYSQTNTFKSALAFGGMHSNGTGSYQGSGLASFASNATSAVTTLTVFSPFGTSMVAGSSVALYGLKG